MAAALLAAARLAGVATRFAVRSLDRYARRWALQSVTREITLADVLLVATMTWGDDEEPPPPAPPEDASTLLVVGTAAAACVLLGCCFLAVDTDDDGSAHYNDDRHARHVVSKRHLDPRLRHRQACNPK